MHSRIPVSRFSLLTTLTIAASIFIFAAPGRAETPPVTPAPVQAAAPVAPVPAQAAPTEPVQRREEEETQAAAPQPPVQASARPGLGAQIKALLGGAQAHAQQITQRDQQIAQLTRDLATARQTIGTLTAELQDLRGLRDELQQTVTGLTQEKRTVQDTVASLGFENAQLPGATSTLPPDETSLRAEMAAATDPKEKHRTAQQLRALREKKD